MQGNEPNREARWKAYYEHHQDRPASALLCAALDLLGPQTQAAQAVDLGCGAGNETRALLQAGWQVLALDQEPAAIEWVQAIGAEYPGARLQTALQRFETLETLPPSSLIHAGMALPFCHPDHFAQFWSVVTAALLPGGVLVGQLFGDRDGWASDPSRTFHSESQARALFRGLDLQTFEVHEYDGSSLRGTKHWHRFDFIAQKTKGFAATSSLSRLDVNPFRSSTLNATNWTKSSKRMSGTWSIINQICALRCLRVWRVM